MDNLLNEILLRIFESFQVSDLISCSHVCSQWEKVITDSMLRQMIMYVYQSPFLQQPQRMCVDLPHACPSGQLPIKKYLSAFDCSSWQSIFRDHRIFRNLTQLIIYSSDCLVTAASGHGRLYLDQCPLLEHLEVHSVSLSVRLNFELQQNNIRLTNLKHLYLDQLDVFSVVKSFPNLVYVFTRQANISHLDSKSLHNIKWTHFSLFETSGLKERVLFFLTMFCPLLEHLKVNLKSFQNVFHLIKTLPKLRYLNFNLQTVSYHHDRDQFSKFLTDLPKLLTYRATQYKKIFRPRLFKHCGQIKENPILSIQDDTGALVAVKQLRRRSVCLDASETEFITELNASENQQIELIFNGVPLNRQNLQFLQFLERTEFHNLNFTEIKGMAGQQNMPDEMWPAVASWTRILHLDFTSVKILSHHRVLEFFTNLRELFLVAQESAGEMESVFPFLFSELASESLSVVSIRKVHLVPQLMLDQLPIYFKTISELELCSDQKDQSLCIKFLQEFPLLNRLELSMFELKQPEHMIHLVETCVSLSFVSLDEIAISGNWMKQLIQAMRKKAESHPKMEISLVYTLNPKMTAEEIDLLTKPANFYVYLGHEN